MQEIQRNYSFPPELREIQSLPETEYRSRRIQLLKIPEVRHACTAWFEANSGMVQMKVTLLDGQDYLN
ncbi:MAG: hypothetical protein WCF65_08660, partial [Parachlamydiaceae bacterium]